MPTAQPKIGPSRGNAGKGRRKGSQNKTTAIAKDAIAQAAEMLGGTERLAAWAKEDVLNERAFWSTIYPKLLPLQIGGTKDPIKILAVTGVPRDGDPEA